MVGGSTAEVNVEATGIGAVQTQSSELSGVITGKEIAQLQLNGHNFTQLATLTLGVNNQSGQDEGTVRTKGSVAFSFNGGRTEYNNWELDGGDNMDNGSNSTPVAVWLPATVSRQPQTPWVATEDRTIPQEIPVASGHRAFCTSEWLIQHESCNSG